ncbi:hypothetical protein EII14_02915 [Alloprevotella sp. OH1205_COT-284]|uniref:hypothetical protein n=1 Tax=Alloprevotella sp. OH1205_COT-284 TaxID=2491043 RepID=UPI000F5E4EF0|nr:hypothetical protein [Alloprevotella sp. OH1205_COT-284]RRD80275.1 hypothetical protein EII14_02915 [Alloprevotella sp. OH1205_COT-284]
MEQSAVRRQNTARRHAALPKKAHTPLPPPLSQPKAHRVGLRNKSDPMSFLCSRFLHCSMTANSTFSQ